MKKRRVSYEIKGTKFEFDKNIGEYSVIPEFLEIEAKDAATIYKYAKKLGFKKKDCKPWSAKELKEYYSKQDLKTPQEKQHTWTR